MTIVLGTLFCTTSNNLEDSYKIDPIHQISLQVPYVSQSKLFYMSQYIQGDFLFHQLNFLIGNIGFALTEFMMMVAIWAKSKLMWSSERNVDKHVCDNML